MRLNLKKTPKAKIKVVIFGAFRSTGTKYKVNKIALFTVAIVTGLFGTYVYIKSKAATPQFAGSITNYTDPTYQTGLNFGDRSHWIQPWRGYEETVPSTNLNNSIGINFNVKPEEADSTARLLAANGFKYARVEIGWGEINYDNPNAINSQAILTARLQALKKYGIRPLILLNSHHGVPTATKFMQVNVTQAAAAGDRQVQLDAASAAKVIPNKSGLNNLTGYKAEEVIFTSVNGNNMATLSKPLPVAVSAGVHSAAVLKYEPFQGPFLKGTKTTNPKYEETMQGWLDYTGVVTRMVKSQLGSSNFDIEIWNELSFASNFLHWQNYYDPNSDAGEGDVTVELANRTVAYLRNPANGVSDIGITNGFTSQRPWGSGVNSPPGLSAMSKHLYAGNRDFPRNASYNGLTPKDALGVPSFTRAADGTIHDKFVPTYDAFFPEYYLTGIQTETLIRDLSPITTPIYGTPHGRNTSPDGGVTKPKIWMTEWNMDPAGADLGDPTNAGGALPDKFTAEDAQHMQAKSDLRFLTSYVNKGLDRVYFYAAHDNTLSLINTNFFNNLPKGYPGDSSGGEIIDAIGRLSADMKSSQPITQPREIKLKRIDDYSGNKQFEGNGSASFPPLYNRDVFSFFAYQKSNNSFAIPIYIQTRDVGTLYRPKSPSSDLSRFDLPAERYRLTISGFTGSGTTASMVDPLYGTQIPVNVISRSGDQLVVEVPVTDSPRLLMIDDINAANPGSKRGDITGLSGTPDGKVNLQDLSYVIRKYQNGPSVVFDPKADISGPSGSPDGKVDIYDLSYEIRNYESQ